MEGVPSPHFNEVYGLVHFNRTSAEAVDYNEVVDHLQKQMDVRTDALRFIRVVCASVEEARKRAAVLAVLTYNIKDDQFVRLFTRKALEAGFFL